MGDRHCVEKHIHCARVMEYKSTGYGVIWGTSARSILPGGRGDQLHRERGYTGTWLLRPFEVIELIVAVLAALTEKRPFMRGAAND